MCQPSSLQAHQEWQQVTGKLFWWDYFFSKMVTHPCHSGRMYRIVHSSALALCTPAIILWLSFRQSCFWHDLEISIALAIHTGNNQDSRYSVYKNSSEMFLCCVLAIAASKYIVAEIFIMNQSPVQPYFTAGNVSFSSSGEPETLAQVQQPRWPHSFLIP